MYADFRASKLSIYGPYTYEVVSVSLFGEYPGQNGARGSVGNGTLSLFLLNFSHQLQLSWIREFNLSTVWESPGRKFSRPLLL